MRNRFVLHFNLNRIWFLSSALRKGFTTTCPYDEDMEVLNKDNLNKSMRKSYFDCFENTAHIAFCMLTALLSLLLLLVLFPIRKITYRQTQQTQQTHFDGCVLS